MNHQATKFKRMGAGQRAAHKQPPGARLPARHPLAPPLCAPALTPQNRNQSAPLPHNTITPPGPSPPGLNLLPLPAALPFVLGSVNTTTDLFPTHDLIVPRGQSVPSTKHAHGQEQAGRECNRSISPGHTVGSGGLCVAPPPRCSRFYVYFYRANKNRTVAHDADAEATRSSPIPPRTRMRMRIARVVTTGTMSGV